MRPKPPPKPLTPKPQTRSCREQLPRPRLSEAQVLEDDEESADLFEGRVWGLYWAYVEVLLGLH